MTLSNTDEHIPDEADLDPADDLPAPDPDEALTDKFDRVDYLAVDGVTVVTVFTLADGSAIKAWTNDGGKTYTTRNIKADGTASLRSTTPDMTPAEVNALVAFNSLAIERRRDA